MTKDDGGPAFHPIQIDGEYKGYPSQRRMLPTAVTLAAYEVYCHVYAPQPALIEGQCRGGFSLREVIAFLYARSFPKSEWHARVEEAFKRPDAMLAARKDDHDGR